MKTIQQQEIINSQTSLIDTQKAADNSVGIANSNDKSCINVPLINEFDDFPSPASTPHSLSPVSKQPTSTTQLDAFHSLALNQLAHNNNHLNSILKNQINGRSYQSNFSPAQSIRLTSLSTTTSPIIEPLSDIPHCPSAEIINPKKNKIEQNPDIYINPLSKHLISLSQTPEHLPENDSLSPKTPDGYNIQSLLSLTATDATEMMNSAISNTLSMASSYISTTGSNSTFESTSEPSLSPRLSFFSNRVRKTTPRRSPSRVQTSPQTATNRRIRLDIYTAYFKNPRSLLYKPPPKQKKRIPTNGTIRAAFRESKCIPSTSTSDISPDTEKFKTLFKGQKALPEELRQDIKIDLTRFKVLENVPPVSWKGANLDIPPTSEHYTLLAKEELQTCRILRIYPAQYLHIKETMLKQVMKGPFKKRDAQAWFRIDVNKTNRLFDWFSAMQWIPSFDEWDEKVSEWMV